MTHPVTPLQVRRAYAWSYSYQAGWRWKLTLDGLGDQVLASSRRPLAQ